MEIPPLILYRDGESRVFDDMRDDWGDSFHDSGWDVIDCLLEGRKPFLTGEDGLAIMAYETAYLSCTSVVAGGGDWDELIYQDITTPGAYLRCAWGCGGVCGNVRQYRHITTPNTPDSAKAMPRASARAVPSSPRNHHDSIMKAGTMKPSVPNSRILGNSISASFR